MKIIIGMLLFALSSTVFANDTSIYFGGWSKHFAVKGGVAKSSLNEQHQMFVVEHNNIVAGYFKNSYGDDSGVIARKYHIMSNNTLSFDISVGASYGYKACRPRERYPLDADKLFCPAVVPELTYTKYEGKYSIQPSVMIISGAVVLALKVQI